MDHLRTSLFTYGKNFCFSAEACAILQVLCWSRQHQQVCHCSSPTIRFSFCPRHPVLSFIFPFISNTVADLAGNSLLFPPVLSGYNGYPDIRFSRRTTRLMSCPDGERYLHPLQSLVVSIVLSLLSILVFSRTGGVLSHLNSSTQRFP